MGNRQHIAVSNQFKGEIEEWVLEDAEPVQHDQSLIIQKERITTTWVRQNMIKVGKNFGVDFSGHEEEALELLMQIDRFRQGKWRLSPQPRGLDTRECRNSRGSLL